MTPDDVPFVLKEESNLLSLEVIEKLDRETRASYPLTIEAFDGGSPEKSGSMSVLVIVDVSMMIIDNHRKTLIF